MATRLSILRRTSWCLLIAFLLAVFAPTAKTVWAGEASQVVWVHLCTADGGRLIPFDQDGEPATQLDGEHAGHCLLCFHSCGFPPRASFFSATVAVGSLFRVFYRERAHEGRVWNTPPSTGPPVHA